MKCHYCGVGDTRVVETRDVTTERAYTVRRRRTCKTCKRSFYTSEIIFTGPHHTKLTMDEVRVIRHMKSNNPSMTHAAIAKRFGVKQNTITRILNGMAWPAFIGPRKQDAAD